MPETKGVHLYPLCANDLGFLHASSRTWSTQRELQCIKKTERKREMASAYGEGGKEEGKGVREGGEKKRREERGRREGREGGKGKEKREKGRKGGREEGGGGKEGREEERRRKREREEGRK
jgi:hypothetical protein